MSYSFENIPYELKSLPQWILWRMEEKNGKKTKVPYQIDGTMAQSNNRATWSTFPTAVKYYLENDFDGIGFMFSNQDDFIGIDIDKCVTNEVTNAFAKEIIDLMDSYTEFSPSGNGIHIIVKGKLPSRITGTGKKSTKHGLEVYSYGRYFTFTGNKENDNHTIFDRTDELEELFDKYFNEEDLVGLVKLEEYQDDKIILEDQQLWEKMFNSEKNGAEIRQLYEGNLIINNDHSSCDLALCNHLAFWTGKSAIRMDRMFRQSGLMRDKWDKNHFGNETYGNRTINIAISSTKTTILEHERKNEQFSVTIKEQPKKKNKKSFMRTELGNAERIAYEHGENIRYVHESGWYIWDGKRWNPDRKKEIEKIASKTLRSLFKSEDEEDRKWAGACEKRAIRMNSIKDLMPLVPAEREEFDQHKFLFNVANGVMDLKTGDCLPHDRGLMMTKLSPINYDPTATCPNWLTFLESIFQGDKELIEFMQRLIGYSLTGDISEQIMVFLIGGGRNGKSTFINTIEQLFGDYSRQTNSNTFIKKANESSVNNDIARLAGARFVSAVESEDGEVLSESLVKQVTGGEKIMARFLRQEFFEFIPEFKVFFTTNHKPVIKGADEGIWRRIRLVPFNLTIPKHQIDKKLKDKLSFELPGIFNWAVEGCLKWQRDGLKEPSSVLEATESYKEEMDILGPFISEMCSKNPLAKTESKDLYRAYERWCYENGEKIILGNRSFYRLLETQGYKKERGNGNKMLICGLKLGENKQVYIKQNVSKSY